MGNSFQDQFLKAGLIDKKQANKAAKEQRNRKKQKHHRARAADIDENKQRIEQAQAEKIERDRLFNQQRKEAAEQKAIAAQIKQLIELNCQPRDEGDISFNFVDDNKIKQISVTEKQHLQLTNGAMAIVKLADKYEIVPRPVAEKIAARSDECVIHCTDKTQQEEGDDPYADYKIPDDLMW